MLTVSFFRGKSEISWYEYYESSYLSCKSSQQSSSCFQEILNKDYCMCVSYGAAWCRDKNISNDVESALFILLQIKKKQIFCVFHCHLNITAKYVVRWLISASARGNGI